MSKPDTQVEKTPSDASIPQDDQYVFELLAEAEKRLMVDYRQLNMVTEHDYQFPSPDSYNWKNPLNLILTGH